VSKGKIKWVNKLRKQGERKLKGRKYIKKGRHKGKKQTNKQVRK
jgi:hypothetical protein